MSVLPKESAAEAVTACMNNRSLLQSAANAASLAQGQSNAGGAVRNAMKSIVLAMRGLNPWSYLGAGTGAAAGGTLDKHQVRAIFGAAEFAAQTVVIQRFGRFDEFDPQLGAAYDKVFYALIAERCPDRKIEDLVSLLNS